MRKELATTIADALNTAGQALIERDKLKAQLDAASTVEARAAAADAGIVWILEPTYETENGATVITGLVAVCKQARRVKDYTRRAMNPVVEYPSEHEGTIVASEFFPSEEAANLAKAVEELDARHEREVCRAYMQIRRLSADDLKALAGIIKLGHYHLSLPPARDSLAEFIAQRDAEEAKGNQHDR